MSIVSEIQADLDSREAEGRRRYGMTVDQANMDLSAWLQHAYEECLDMAIYLKRAMSILGTDDASDCLAMIHGEFEQLGMDMSGTPPMNYGDAMQALIFERLKEAGAFPGHDKTVEWIATDDPKVFTKKSIANAPEA